MLGDDRVFRDIDGIAGGADFAQVIGQTLETADAVIVMIGRNWLDAEVEHGHRRIEDPEDTRTAAAVSVDATKSGACATPPKSWPTPLNTAQSGLIFLVVVPASALLLVFAHHVDPGRRGVFNAAAWVGSIGAFIAFVLFYLVCKQYEITVLSFTGLTVAPLMLVLLVPSRFKPR